MEEILKDPGSHSHQLDESQGELPKGSSGMVPLEDDPCGEEWPNLPHRFRSD